MLLVALIVAGYFLMMAITLAIVKCVNGSNYDPYNDAPIAIFWPVSLIVGTFRFIFVAADKIANFIVAKFCPNKKS